uniref:Uncharacterized protein n=1 Tax=Acrobeloides nanus TaxID=290746 RepID=A0A914E000_9BILA
MSLCKCVLKPGTNNCLQYDDNYQADNLNEAIDNFVDLTTNNNQLIFERNKACEDLLLERLAELGLKTNSKISKINSSKINLTCPEYRFTNQSDLSLYQYGNGSKESKTRLPPSVSLPPLVRKTRQAISPNGNEAVLGTRFIISCTAKGIDDGSGYLKLCYATCGLGIRTFEFIRNDTGTPTLVSLATGAYCECKVLDGSPLTNLVTG